MLIINKIYLIDYEKHIIIQYIYEWFEKVTNAAILQPKLYNYPLIVYTNLMADDLKNNSSAGRLLLVFLPPRLVFLKLTKLP